MTSNSAPLCRARRRRPRNGGAVRASDGADAPASPKSAIDAEISRLQCDKIVADVLLEEATARKKKAAAAAAEVEAEEPKRRASREFGEAHYAWLTAKARIEDPNVEDDDLARLGLEAEAAAERRLMTTPAAWPDQVWQKLGRSRPFSPMSWWPASGETQLSCS